MNKMQRTLRYAPLRIRLVQTGAKTERIFVFTNPARNYSMCRQVTFPFEGSTLSPHVPKSGFRSQSRTRLRQTSSPFERRRLVARKNGGASAEKKGLGNAKSHLKPPGSSFEDPSGSQILFAVAYVYLSAAFVAIHTCI